MSQKAPIEQFKSFRCDFTVNGKPGGNPDPQDKATRAEAAAVLMCFCESGK